MNNTTEAEIKAYQNKKADIEANITYLEAKLKEAKLEQEANEASAGAKLLERENTRKALEAAAKVKVRDYLLVDDIAEQAMTIPAEITFGDLIDIALEAYAGDHAGKAAQEYAWAAAEWLDEKAGNALDSEAANKVARATANIIDRCDEAEIVPIELL